MTGDRRAAGRRRPALAPADDADRVDQIADAAGEGGEAVVVGPGRRCEGDDGERDRLAQRQVVGQVGVGPAHVVDHDGDPGAAAAELGRVSPAGFIQVPSRASELVYGGPLHRWLVDLDGENGLVFATKEGEPAGGPDARAAYEESLAVRLGWASHRSRWQHSVTWAGAPSVRIDGTPGPSAAPPFDTERTIAHLEEENRRGRLSFMPPAVMEQLRCPACGGALSRRGRWLDCAESALSYPVVGPVPLLPLVRECVSLVEPLARERDVLRRTADGALGAGDLVVVADAMTSPADTVDAAIDVTTALQLMRERGYRHMPVLRDGDIAFTPALPADKLQAARAIGAGPMLKIFLRFRRDLWPARRSSLTGIALMCCALACFSCLDTTAKYLNTHMDTLQTIWARYMSAFVLTLLTLPTIIIASRAALKAVPPSIREGALAVGASLPQTVFQHVLPLAAPLIRKGNGITGAAAIEDGHAAAREALDFVASRCAGSGAS